jgi:hypothetical protein
MDVRLSSGLIPDRQKSMAPRCFLLGLSNTPWAMLVAITFEQGAIDIDPRILLVRNRNGGTKRGEYVLGKIL